MTARKVIFEVSGPDSKIAQLHRETCLPVYAGPRDHVLSTGEHVHYIALVIVTCELEEAAAVDAAVAWLRKNKRMLRSLNGNKKIEIQTAILPGEGSRALSLSMSAMRALMDTKCDFLHQYSRTLSPEEVDRHGLRS